MSPELPDEEQVRRLLADARHTEPMPDDVAERLDAALADLSPETSAADAVVGARRRVDLAAARRRRNARTWLVAAAAAVLIGVGVQQLPDLGMSSDDADSASDQAVSGAADSADGGRRGAEHAPAEAPTVTSEDLPRGFVRLHQGDFGGEVKRLRDRRPALDYSPQAGVVASDGYLLDGLRADKDSPLRSLSCDSTGWGRGRVVAVTYEGEPGGLVFRRPRGDTQVVDLLLCGEAEPTRSITLPAP